MTRPQMTETFSALGWTFAIESSDALLVRYLDSIFVHLRVDGAPDHSFEIRDNGVWLDGEGVCGCATAASQIAQLQSCITSRAIEFASRDSLLLHASAVAKAGRVLVIAGSSGAGKSTLCAALILDGWDYVTDEVVAMPWLSRGLVAYAKPVTLKPGSWPLLPSLRPSVSTDAEAYVQNEWHVVAPTVARAGTVSALVLLEPQAGSTRLTRLRGAARIMRVAEHCLNPVKDGSRWLQAIAAISERTFTLDSESLLERTRIINEVCESS